MTWRIEDAAGHAMMVRGWGQGPEIVWIHGLGEWSLAFDAIARHPALAGFTHTLIDLPGYGRSPWPSEPDGLEQLADRLATWLIARSRPAVIGHSMGGVLATLLGERDAVSAVIDVDGNLTAGDCTFSGKAAAHTREAFLAHGFAALRDEIYEAGRTSPAIRGYHAAMLAASPDCFHRHASDLVAISATETLAARFAALAMPALFVAGVPDGVCADSLAALDLHRARWVGLTPAGHWVYVDQPDAFAAAVVALLS